MYQEESSVHIFLLTQSLVDKGAGERNKEMHKNSGQNVYRDPVLFLKPVRPRAAPSRMWEFIACFPEPKFKTWPHCGRAAHCDVSRKSPIRFPAKPGTLMGESRHFLQIDPRKAWLALCWNPLTLSLSLSSAQAVPSADLHNPSMDIFVVTFFPAYILPYDLMIHTVLHFFSGS